jgi:hypothetical protein
MSALPITHPETEAGSGSEPRSPTPRRANSTDSWVRFSGPVFWKSWRIWNEFHANKKMQSYSDDKNQWNAEPISDLQIVDSLLL